MEAHRAYWSWPVPADFHTYFCFCFIFYLLASVFWLRSFFVVHFCVRNTYRSSKVALPVCKILHRERRKCGELHIKAANQHFWYVKSCAREGDRRDIGKIKHTT